MDLKCSVCKRKIDVEKEVALVFQCHVYCDRCMQQMEEKDRTPPHDTVQEESDLENVQ
jgi:hypothetical protein